MTEQPIQTDQEEETNLLDVLVTLAESWKLLVFGPLISGVLAGGLSFMWPKTYESVAVVHMSEAELALLNTAPVLDSLIEKFDLLPSFGGVKDVARQYLVKKIVGKIDKKTGYASITVTYDSPEKAQEIAKATIDALLEELLPKGKNKSKIELQIATNDSLIGNYKEGVDKLQKQIGKLGSNEQALDAVMKHFVALNVEIANRQLENYQLKKSLEVRGDEVYLQRASFPERNISPNKRFIVTLSVLCSSVLLLVFVFVRKAIELAKRDLKTSRKLDKIRVALGWRRCNQLEC